MSKKIISLVFVSLIILTMILPTESVKAAACPTDGSNPKEAVCNPATQFFLDLTTKGKQNTFGDLILFVIERGLQIVGLIALLFIIYGGYQYILARGDEEAAQAGKKTLTNAIIGLVIVIISYTIIIVIIGVLK